MGKTYVIGGEVLHTRDSYALDEALHNKTPPGHLLEPHLGRNLPQYLSRRVFMTTRKVSNLICSTKR